ncbi:MAG: PAS domain S-box protein, partial [Rhodothermales bacterium]|nr:PAS domain S-box protein [Rhodothermales bacterium]
PYEFSGTALHDERGQLVGLCGTARDLTERKEAEVALQQSEARYRGLVEASPDIFFRLSREGRHRDVIVADPTKLAVDIDAIVGFTVAELLPPPVAEQWQEAIGAALDTGQLREIEYELHTLSGELHRYEARMVPVGSDEVQAIVRDVTERYRSERALRANEIRFRSFVEATAQVVFRADAAGGVTELSDAWSRFTGQTPEEVEGWGWVEALHPEDRAWVLAEWADHIEARTPYAPEFRVRRRDGVYHRFSVRSVPVHDGDTFLGWVGTCTDVEDVRRSEEALRQSEERRRLALEAAQMGTWAYDIAGDTVAWSPRTYALFGIEPAREPYPKAAFYDLLHEADRDRLRAATEAAVREAGAGGSGEIDVEYRVPRAGELRWFRSVGRVVLDEAQRPARVMGTVRDVTDEKAHEAALVEAKEAAEEARVRSEEARRAAEDAARLKSALLANMSHEIRTPLTGIIGFAEVLAEEVQGEQGEFARLIGRNGRRLMNTLDSVLDLAQIEAGRYRLVPDVLDLGAAASEAVSLFHLQAEAKGIGLRVEAPATPVRALADASALARVIINLVSNAVKFTSEGAVTVTVRGVEEAPGHGAAEVRVADSGVGIADAFLPNVFEEFRQESEGEARYFEGSGLGLSITRRLVEMMGGSIAVESEKGIGSTFTVRLPQAD